MAALLRACSMRQLLNSSGNRPVTNLNITISDKIKRAMTDHALLTRPEECCGVLSGSNGDITDLHPLRNEAAEPETRYVASPQDLFAAMRRIRESGQAMMGIYHSHPRSAPYPSPTDVAMAFYPEAFYFIISLEPRLDIRAFRIEDGRILEAEVSVSGEEVSATN